MSTPQPATAELSDQALADSEDLAGLPPAAAAPQPARWAPLLGGIGRRLLVRILLFSSLITLLLTAVQLYLDYGRDVDLIAARVEQVRSSYHDSLARSLWNVDSDQVRIQLEGIASLPDVQAGTLLETGDTLRDPLRVAVGKPAPNARLAWTIPIIYNDRGMARAIGALTIEGSLDKIYSRLTNRALLILAGQGVKTFLVSFFILFIVHSLVTRHLVALAHHMRGYDVRRPAQSPTDNSGHAADDELRQMYDAFNALQKN